MFRENDLVPPSAVEIEELVLAALFIEEKAINEIVTILAPNMFYKPIHQKIYERILYYHESGGTFDIFTIAQEIKKDYEESSVSQLADMTMKISSANKIKEHALIIREKYILRVFVAKFSHSISRIANDGDAEDVLATVNKDVEEINSLLTGVSNGSSHISSVVEKALDEAQVRQVKYESGQSVAISTGLKELDKKVLGWRGGDMIVIGGRPGAMKTQLMLHHAFAAAKQGTPVCIYSLEMGDVSLVNRILLSMTNIDREMFKRGILEKSDWIQLERAANILSKMPIYIDSKHAVSMDYIRAHSTIMHRQGKCGIVFIDYLQLTDMPQIRRSGTREQDVSQVSRAIKLLAGELDIPIVVLSQLSRKVEERADKMPQLADLRESGSLEQDPDMVIFIYRPEYYEITEIETSSFGVISSRGVGILNIAKQRDGATGKCFFAYDDTCTKIFDYGQRSEHISPDSGFDF